MTTTKPAVLITGASSGIGAVYADRFARRGHDLVLVARDIARLKALADRLVTESRVRVDVVQSDLTQEKDLKTIEGRLAADRSIGILVNNAGVAIAGTFADQKPDAIEDMIRLNVLAVARLTAAALPGFLARSDAAIINIASVVAMAPELPLGMYGATKAFVLAMSQALQAEFAGRGLYVQAVLPSSTRTEIWERGGRDVNSIAAVMDVEEMVDAALVGFDVREPVTLPSLPDVAQWESFEAARRAMLPNYRQNHAAPRYRQSASSQGTNR